MGLRITIRSKEKDKKGNNKPGFISKLINFIIHKWKFILFISLILLLYFKPEAVFRFVFNFFYSISEGIGR